MQLPFSKPPEAWTEEDLQRLCADRVPEHQRLDYKELMTLDPPRDGRKELLKDVTALANSLGGILIYGIREEKHPDLGTYAGSLIPLTDTTLIDRANRVLRSNTSPPVECHFYSIEASEGGFYIIAHVPQSRIRPHAVTFESRLDWYIRRNQDNFRMTEPEIRAMFEQTSFAQLSLRQRYDELELSVPGIANWTIVTMPHIPGLQLLDTLTVTGRELTSSAYVRLVGGSNFLQPRVDRFEEVIDASRYCVVTRLFQTGEFMVGEGFNAGDTLPTAIIYRRWYLALKYFHELYTGRGYYGTVRVWLGTNNLNDPEINIGIHRRTLRFQRDSIIVWRDLPVEQLHEPSIICNNLFRLFAQACHINLRDEDLKEYEAYAKSN